MPSDSSRRRSRRSSPSRSERACAKCAPPSSPEQKVLIQWGTGRSAGTPRPRAAAARRRDLRSRLGRISASSDDQRQRQNGRYRTRSEGTPFPSRSPGPPLRSGLRTPCAWYSGSTLPVPRTVTAPIEDRGLAAIVRRVARYIRENAGSGRIRRLPVNYEERVTVDPVTGGGKGFAALTLSPPLTASAPDMRGNSLPTSRSRNSPLTIA